MPTTHDKLIRDRIPQIMDEAGVEYVVDTLDDKAYETSLRAKLIEEASEAAAATSRDEVAKEVADVLEVALALLKVHDLTHDDVERMREQRRATRGGFERKLFLRSTTP